jgi:hypothetical protein
MTNIHRTADEFIESLHSGPYTLSEACNIINTANTMQTGKLSLRWKDADTHSPVSIGCPGGNEKRKIFNSNTIIPGFRRGNAPKNVIKNYLKTQK